MNKINLHSDKKEYEFAIPMLSSKIVFFFVKSLLNMYACVYYVHIFEELFFQNMVSELGIDITTSIFG